MTKIFRSVLAAGLLFSVAAPLAANAASAPKTKAACEKVKTMTWDDATSKCVKK